MFLKLHINYGFYIVVLFTDLPFILSGDTIAVLDPHRVNIDVRNEDGSLKTGHWLELEDFRKYLGSVHCFKGLFGCSPEKDQYSGTIFRFPFRNCESKSEISSSQYDPEMVIKNLYKSLVEESPFLLLFLKNITSIGLYRFNTNTNQEELMYRVYVDYSSVSSVQEGRNKCKQSANYWESCSNIFCHINSIPITIENHFVDSVPGEGRYNWLVVNCIAGQNCNELQSLSNNLMVIPWVGVAAQLPSLLHVAGYSTTFSSGNLDVHDRNITELLDQLSSYKEHIPWEFDKPPDIPGHAFCFLPLPSKIGLPVCIHGYFSVADNRRSIKWPSHDEQGEEAKFNKVLVDDLITPLYAILLACRSTLIEYTNFPVLYKNSHELLDPYCLWPLLSQSSGGHSMWLTLVEQVITLLVNNDLKVAWTAASGGQRISLLSALYLPGTFSDTESDVSEVVVETLIALNQPLVILPIAVIQAIRDIPSLRAKLQCREISPSKIRDLLRKTAISHMNNIVVNKVNCTLLLDYVLSDLSSTSCHELLSVSLLPVEEAEALPKPFSQQDCIYMLADKNCVSFLQEITDQLVWSGLSLDVSEQLEMVNMQFNFCQLKMADAKMVCTELIPMSMKKWTNCNGEIIQWRPNAHSHPPLQWLSDLWEWLNVELSKDVGLDDIMNFPIFPKENLDSSSFPSIITLIPLSYSKNCFLLSKNGLVPQFLLDFVERIGFTVVHETHFVFMHSQIKSQFNPISPESIITALGNSTNIRNIARYVEQFSSKGQLLEYISEVNKPSLSREEVNAIRQLPLFKRVGDDQQFVALNSTEWILLTEGIQFPLLLQYPPNIIHYRSLAEYRLLKLLDCPQPTYTDLCISHIIPFALNCSSSNVNNTNVLMKWILCLQMDETLSNHLCSCEFVPRGTSNQLSKPSELYDPEDPKFQYLFDPQENCIPSSEYKECFFRLRKLGLQTWDTISSDTTRLSQFIFERASTVTGLFMNKVGNNIDCAHNRSIAIIRLLNEIPNLNKSLLTKLEHVPFLLPSARPLGYPTQLEWYGEGKSVAYSPRDIYPARHQLLVGSIGIVLDERNVQIECRCLDSLLKQLCVSDLLLQLTTLATVSMPSHEISRMVYLIYDQLSKEDQQILEDNQNMLPSEWIWIEENCKFVSAEKCSVYPINDLDLSPHFYTLSQLPQLKHYHEMFRFLGVPKEFTDNDISRVFRDIANFCQSGGGLNNSHLKVILHMLQWVHCNGKETMQVLLPTENMQLLPPEDCTYNDRYWCDKQPMQSKYAFVHPEIPLERAKYFNVVPLGQRLAPSRRLGLKYKQKGPHQSVTSRLKEAIQDYEFDIDVFKELIQNADDAHATEVKFVIDWRQHPCDTLLEPEMKPWQGPALIAYNNAVFTANDFKNICELAGGSKKSDPTKIGRFGIGFCSVYHLTDVPSFISSNYFTVFDPHTSYLGDRVSAGEPGMQIDLTEDFNDLDEFKDQFAPYCKMFGFKMEEVYNGTLFRFPFRNGSTAGRSKISNVIHDQQRVEELCNSLKESAPELLLFLQHVKEVSLYEIEVNSSVENMKHVLSVTKTVELNSVIGPNLIEQYRLGLSSSQSYEKKIFKVEGFIDQESQKNYWMVISCLGSDKSRTLAQSSDNKLKNLCPLAEIGVKLNKTDLFYPEACNGKVFCFLPLPVECNFKFYCNGYFDISKDRRWLTKDNTGQLTEWNSAVISDALYYCFVNMIVALTTLNSLSNLSTSDKEKFLKVYYSLWPNKASDHNEIYRILFNEVKTEIPLTDKCILWSDVDGGKWLSPNDVYTYVHSSVDQPEIEQEIVSLLLEHDYPVVDISCIISTLGESIQNISYKDFCGEVLIPFISTLPCETRDRQITALLLNLADTHFVDHNDEWAKPLLIQTNCIPTKPNGCFRKPGDLINPKSSLARLYDDSDERFPTDVYMKETKIVDVLRRLGMSHDALNMDDLKDRALSVRNLGSEEAAIQRAKEVLMYISRIPVYYYNTSTHGNILYDALCDVPFIPVYRHAEGFSLPWYQCLNLFQSPKNMYSSKQLNLVFTQAPVIMPFEGDDNSAMPVANSLITLKIASKKPSLEVVLNHFVQLVKHAQQNSFNDIDVEMLNNCCPAVYKFLSETLTIQEQEFDECVNVLKDLPFIWQYDHFLSVDQVVFKSGISDAYPYLCELSDDNKKYLDFFVKIGVLKSLNKNRILSILKAVNEAYSQDAKLTAEHVQFVFNLAQKLTQFLEYPSECCNVLYLPNEDALMKPVNKLAYRETIDFPDLASTKILSKHFESGVFWLHRIFSGDLAKSLGIPSALNSILNCISMQNFLDGTDYGQHENLCDRLNSILRKYPHDESIFKEFIQNADDAGASEIVFILDHRKFNPQDDKLFSREPEWKSLHHCPSLLVYNRKMSEEDINGITKLGKGNKGFSPELIGRFGIGFNVAYHVTDCPMFVSYSSGGVPENFCILDPGSRYAPGHQQRPIRGRRFKLGETELQQFSEEFKPFCSDAFVQISETHENCFNDIRTGFSNGCVVFRLPFTRSSNSCKSNLNSSKSEKNNLLKGCKMNSRYMHCLLSTLECASEDLLLFLSNVKNISAFQIHEDGTCGHYFTTSVFLSDEDSATCKEYAKQLKQEIKAIEILNSEADDEFSVDVGSDTLHNSEEILLDKISWNYQLNIETLKCEVNKSSHDVVSSKSTSVWLISHCFGGNDIPSDTLKAALSNGLMPRGGIAIRLEGSVERSSPYPYMLFNSLPLTIRSHMPVHVNGNFWVDDSRKHLEIGTNQPLSNWNCQLTKTIISDAYVNALLCCKEFLQDKGTEWYYSNFPRKGNTQDSKLHSYGLDKSVYYKVTDKELLVLEQDSPTVTWLPVVGQDCGHFFSLNKALSSDKVNDEAKLRNLLIEFGVNLCKAPGVIYEGISSAASTHSGNTYTAMIDQVFFIQLLKSLDLQQHANVIKENIILLLKYCLSSEEGLSAIDGTPLLLACDGSVHNLTPTVYGSQYSQLLPHMPNSFINSILEEDEFIIDVLTKRGFYVPIPGINFVSANSQLENCSVLVTIEDCQEYHSQIIEHWKYLDRYLASVKTNKYISCLEKFYHKPIIPASNGTLIPVCKAKMVLFPENYGLIQNAMKQLGFTVLDFSILCKETFSRYTDALRQLLAHCHNGDDVLDCIKLNNLSPVLPSDCDLAQLRSDIRQFFYVISSSAVLLSAKDHLCKLPIFETIAADLHVINSLQNTYLVPDRVPEVGLKEVIAKSSVLLLRSSICEAVYQSLGIRRCGVVQFYTKAIIPHIQAMNTEDIISHLKYVFSLSHDNQMELCEILKCTRIVHVAASNEWCFVSDFYDPEDELFKMFLNTDDFPPLDWHDLEDILYLLGLRKDASWEVLLKMAKDVEQEINDQLDCDAAQELTTYKKSSTLLQFIYKKLAALHSGDQEEPLDMAAFIFCKEISKVLFVPIHKHENTVSDFFPIEYNKKRWTSFSNACFASYIDVTFLERDVIVLSFNLHHLQGYASALGIEHPPTCKIVIENLFKLSHVVAQSSIQSYTEQHKVIRDFLKTSFGMHYAFLEEYATLDELKMLQGKECVFVESDYTYSVVSGDCVVKSYQANSMFPYLCQISGKLTECQRIIDVLNIRDTPSSSQYARILHSVYSKFTVSKNKLISNSYYMELACKANDCLIKCLRIEEATKSIPDDFNAAELFLLDKELELCPANQLAYDDVPWYSKRLQKVQTYRYMKVPPRDEDGRITLPQLLGIKLLSSLVVEELDDSVLTHDNVCIKERIAIERKQNHGCPFVCSLVSLLPSYQFKLGLLRIIHHQKNTEPSEAETSLADKLSDLKFSCYNKIKTNLKYVSNDLIIEGSSDTVFCVLIEHTDNGPLLCISPHYEDKDVVVKEIAQNLNRYLGGIILNESHLEAMIKCRHTLDIESALDKCKVKPYTGATGAVVKLPSVGEEIKSTICDLVIVLNYNVGDSVKYWNDNGKLLQAKIIEVNPKLVTNIFTKSITVCTNEDDDSGYFRTSPILLSKYLQPSFSASYNSGNKIDCYGLLLYHLEHDPDFDIALILEQIMSSFQDLSQYQVKVIFKRLFFHSHFYFVKCGKAPDLFTDIIPQYFEAWTNSIESFATASIGKCNELAELMEQMGIPLGSGTDSEDADIGDNVHEVIGRLGSNTEFFENSASVGDDYANLQRIQATNIPSRRPTGAISFHSAQSYITTPQTAQPQVTQPLYSGLSINAFSQHLPHSIPIRSGLYKTSTGGYRSRALPQRPVPVSLWNQGTSASTTNTPPSPPQTNFKKAFMWLKQAIADLNAATHYVKCQQQINIGSEVIINSSSDNSCQFPALICFLSHEVIEKCLKATYLATCGSTLTDQTDLSLVELYDYLSSSRCWPLTDIRDFVHQVSDHNKRSRYPNFQVSSEAPCVVYTELDARHALAAAQEVFIKVCSVECFKDELPPQPSLLPLLPSTIYLGPDGKYLLCCVLFST